ncbi:cache domain-containing protein [Micrococcaceae bacterium Sec7.4]
MSKFLTEAVKNSADVLAQTLDSVFESLKALQEAAEPLLNSPTVAKSDLVTLEPAARNLIAHHAGLVDGAGVAIAPGLLVDAHTWMQSWHTVGGEVGFTRHSLNPASVNYYDYTHMSWFQHPVASGQPSLTGPYWDFGGTDTTIITASLPVVGRGGRISVAAADLSVHFLEVTFLRSLGKQAASVALITEGGKVVASNSARYAVGRSGPILGETHPVPFQNVPAPWKIVFTP